MGYEHPLAYLLGLEGIALLRAFGGEYDREFVEARLREIRGLLDDDQLATAGVPVRRIDTVAGYRAWSRTYDQGRNSAFDVDEPVVTEIVDALPPGPALDAACGTGRWAARLADRGHRVIGVDSSPDMRERARARVPRAEFRPGDLHSLPVDDADVDLVVCALALGHVAELGPVLAEFGRVLRPGGHLVLSELHPERVLRGSIPQVRDEAGRPARLATYRHTVGDHLRAALAVGLRPLRCEEPLPPAATTPVHPDPMTTPRSPGPWELWPWSLADLVPEAKQAANAGTPAMIIWHYQLADAL